MSAGQEQFDPRHFLNRELSWLEFNQRVLDEARDPANPLLERVKFFCISGSNLDEFFEVRVAGIKQQMESDVAERSVDGLTPGECFQAVTRRVRRMVEDQYRCWREELTPALERAGIRFLAFEQLDAAGRLWVERFYHSQVRPVLTPLGIDPAHPFPQLLNKSLNLIVRLEITQRGVTQRRLAVVQVPRILPRLVQLPAPAGRRHYLLLGRLIGAYLGDLFPGTRLLGHWLFRVTRNSELYIDEEESGNLLKAVENEVHNRRKGAAVRLEVAHDCPADIRDVLLETLGLTADDLYAIEGPINPARLMTLCDGEHPPELRDPPFLAPVAAPLRAATDLFAVVRERDVLLHHPYENFSSVVDFLQQAATDPAVLAIKQTLYRTGGDRRIIGALMEAVKNGKQVTAVVELKARFDEANNIQWARQLEEAGVHVVYGLVGYKIHCKLCLVVRHEGDAIRRYVHLGTGNYNPATARIYTDLGLLTARPDLAAEVGDLFNLLTGICQFQGTQKLLVAPFNLHERISDLILRETANARAGLPARIIAKMNSLVEPGIIQALYRASQAGVKIDLIVRGICCLRPGVKGLSENISVRSIVGRFLEHSRIFYFENACQPEVFLGSADWMPRNFFRRIEVVFPVEDGNLRERVINEILALNLADNVKARALDARGRWHRVKAQPGSSPVSCQEELMRRALGGPVEATATKAARKPLKMKLRPRPAA
jgi:polyphosphate kinase